MDGQLLHDSNITLDNFTIIANGLPLLEVESKTKFHDLSLGHRSFNFNIIKSYIIIHKKNHNFT